ncbi:MAG TPA: GGDEF domain-containing protein [Clostridium sp.]
MAFIDLDNFKTINDTFGHKSGDIILQEASKRLSVCLRADDIVCRFGGDKFIIVLKKIDREECVSISERIILEFRNEFVINDGNTVFTSPSIGICLYPQDGKNVEDLLMHADAAMYFAKNNGKNNYHFFS